MNTTWILDPAMTRVSDRENSSLCSSSDDEKSKIDDSGGDFDDAWPTTRFDYTVNRKRVASPDTRFEDNHSNPQATSQSKSKSYAPSPSPSTDERGWSTGVDSSSFSSNEKEYGDSSISSEDEINGETQLRYSKSSKKDDQQNKLRDEWGFTRKLGTDEEELDDGISYDDSEDGSEWLSDAEKVTGSCGTNKKKFHVDVDYSELLPSLEKLPENESSIGSSEIPPSTNNNADSKLYDETARFEKNSFNSSFDEESTFDNFFQSSESVERFRVEKQGDVASNSERKGFTSALTTSSSHRAFNALDGSSKPISQEIFTIFPSDSIPNVAQNNTKSSRQDIADSEGKGFTYIPLDQESNTSSSESKGFTSTSTTSLSHRAFSAFRDSSEPTYQEMSTIFSSDPILSVGHNKTESSRRDIVDVENKGSTSPDQLAKAAHDKSESLFKDRSGCRSKVLSVSSMFSPDRTRSMAQDSIESTSNDRSAYESNVLSSPSMFSSDQSSGVAQISIGSTAYDTSSSASKVFSSSTMASSDGSESTAQDIFGSEKSELKSSPPPASSDRLAGPKTASTVNISLPLIKESPNTNPTTGLSGNSFGNPNRAFVKEGSNFNRQSGTSRLEDAYASLGSLKNVLKDNAGSANGKSKKDAKQLRAQHRNQRNNREFKPAVSDSKSFVKKTSRAKKNHHASKRESLNSNTKGPESKSLSRRHRHPRGSQRSIRRTAISSGRISSIHLRVPRDERNLNDSEATEAHILRTQSNSPRSIRTHSASREESKTKQRARKPSLNRNASRKSPSYESKLKESSSCHLGVSKKTNGKFGNKMKASSSTRNDKSTKKPGRSRNQMNIKNEDFRRSLSGIQVERYGGAGNVVTASCNSTDLAPNALYCSKSVSLLNDYNCGLKTKTKRIHATINNEGYRILVRKAYYKLLEVRPRLKYLLSLSEWLHVHFLLLYARIFDCELHFYGIVLPSEFQIAIPNNIMVLEPIAAVISSIGIVEDVDMGVTYIPVARSYRGDDIYKPHNKDDVTEFLEWTQYDWNSSWYQVEKGRLDRRYMAAELNMKIPKSAAQSNDGGLEEWQQLVVEKWLGWDDDLWFSYNQACYVLGRIGHFVSVPRDSSKRGSYGWLLPRHINDAGAFVRLPRPNLSPDSWMIAVMLDMCSLDPTTTATWYHETNGIDNVQYLVDRFLDAAVTATQSMDVVTNF